MPSSSPRSSHRDLLLRPRALCLHSAHPAAPLGGKKMPRREGPTASWGRPAGKEEDAACLQPLELVRAPRLPPVRGSGRPAGRDPPGRRKTPPGGTRCSVPPASRVGPRPTLRASRLGFRVQPPAVLQGFRVRPPAVLQLVLRSPAPHILGGGLLRRRRDVSHLLLMVAWRSSPVLLFMHFFLYQLCLCLVAWIHACRRRAAPPMEDKDGPGMVRYRSFGAPNAKGRSHLLDSDRKGGRMGILVESS
ncbi:uncharacterized protein [Zea mays]|uniref:Uncharacterized protein n=1 Tax=Zea mays TaxID=4577 RepID=C0PLW2_MAIZE|nr:uncharacterized protein LOC100384142 [Zea mays]ACN36178.1 unknown [Zea mays]|eukprot:XP_020407478.1 uncharacterized protein LOC100384142 [Zea mays]